MCDCPYRSETKLWFLSTVCKLPLDLGNYYGNPYCVSENTWHVIDKPHHGMVFNLDTMVEFSTVGDLSARPGVLFWTTHRDSLGGITEPERITREMCCSSCANATHKSCPPLCDWVCLVGVIDNTHPRMAVEVRRNDKRATDNSGVLLIFQAIMALEYLGGGMGQGDLGGG